VSILVRNVVPLATAAGGAVFGWRAVEVVGKFVEVVVPVM
jgi:hypothetical protein